MGRTFDLILRYVIIIIAFKLACAWIQFWQSPYPLVDAFELADSAEEQLFRSLGISLLSFRLRVYVIICLPMRFFVSGLQALVTYTQSYIEQTVLTVCGGYWLDLKKQGVG